MAFLVSAAVAWKFVADDPADRLSNTDQRASIGALILTTVGLLITAVTIWQGRRPPPFEHRRLLVEAAGELADLVLRQWNHEARVRGLARPAPLRVRWSSTGRPVSPPAAEVLGPGWTAGRPTRLKLHGDVHRVAAALRLLPARRLVVIGAPGAGKTSLAVLLVRELLGDRAAGEPVPVLLSLSRWRPDQQTLQEWLVRQITAAYPPLGSAEHFGPQAVSRLLSAGLIMPVLDGLDELAHDLLPRAVTRLNNYLTEDRPIVVTCRAAEYEEIVGQVGAVLARAAVVELEPVSNIEAADYLPAGQGEPGRRRWEPVTRHLRECPDGLLAQVFSTPLMVHLARVVYRERHTFPSELLGFGDPAALEDHLLRGYVPALYAEHDAARRPYPPASAQWWLSYLAVRMNRSRTRDLTWWQLVNAVPFRLTHQAVSGIVLVALLTHLVVLRGSTSGLALGITVLAAATAGPVIGVVMGMADGRPCRVRLRPRAFVEGFATGSALALCGTPLILVVSLIAEPMLGALTRTVVQQAGLCLIVGTAVGIVTFLIEGIGTTDGGTRASLREDRNSFLLVTVVAIVAVGLLTFGIMFPLAVTTLASTGTAMLVSAQVAVTLGVIIGLTSGAGAAWLRFTYARVWLAAHDLAPWHVLDFLDDAHDRGVLRKVGPAYQFRHARLQSALSRRRRSPGAGTAAEVTSSRGR